jgi:hypothetical protein
MLDTTLTILSAEHFARLGLSSGAEKLDRWASRSDNPKQYIVGSDWAAPPIGTIEVLIS